MRMLLLNARRYSFKDERDREVSGVTLNYLDPACLDDGPRGRGLFPLATSCDDSVWGKLGALPGIYNVDFSMRPGKNNKATLKLVDVSFCEPVDIAKIVEIKTSEKASAKFGQ